MDDQTAAQQIAEGVFLIVGSFTTIPAAIVAGVTTLAGAFGYMFGTKHEQKRAAKKADSDFIQKILDNKENQDA